MKDWLIVLLSVLGFYGILYIIKGWEEIKNIFVKTSKPKGESNDR